MGVGVGVTLSNCLSTSEKESTVKEYLHRLGTNSCILEIDPFFRSGLGCENTNWKAQKLPLCENGGKPTRRIQFFYIFLTLYYSRGRFSRRQIGGIFHIFPENRRHWRHFA